MKRFSIVVGKWEVSHMDAGETQILNYTKILILKEYLVHKQQKK
jgi:hypothetical protein